MRSYITILLFVVFNQLVLAQNYQPVNSSSLQAFYNINPEVPDEAYWPGSVLGVGNVWGTRIDSSTVSMIGDSIYFNYPIHRETSDIQSGNSCIKPNLPNWNGSKTRVDQGGSSWFYNQTGDSVRIFHEAPVNEQWLAYTYPNGDSIIATTTSVLLVDDGWIEDSIKTVAFQRFSNGSTISDPVNNVKVELYRTAGFRKAVDFHQFPLDTMQIHRIDLNCINKNSPGYIRNGNTPVPYPAVGDGFYRVRSCEDLSGVGGFGNLCTSPQQDFSEQILDVVPDINGEVSVSILQNTQNNSSIVNETYVPLPDSVDLLHTTGHMPKEEGATYWARNASLISDSEECVRLLVSASSWDVYWTEVSGIDTCLVEAFSECGAKSVNWFAGYIGYISHSYIYDNTYCTEFAHSRTYYSYIKLGGIQCGIPQMVSVKERPEQLEFTAYPNPTEGTVYLRLANSMAQKIIVKDVFGQSIVEFEPKNLTYKLDVSSWKNGVYFIIVSDINGLGLTNTQKLIVQH